MERTRKTMLSILAIAFLLLFQMTDLVHAEGTPYYRYAAVNDDSVKIYVENAPEGEGTQYQIGNVAADAPTSYPVTEDDLPVRTLFMVDNSLSIPEGARTQITELMQMVVDSHMEKETFRVATFSGDRTYMTDSYSDDYTAVKNVISSITYNKQSTFLTDVVSTVLNDISQEKYMGYGRIIIISDGMDSNPQGITREELMAQLQKLHFPIYTIGIELGDNDELLKNMFALSRGTNAAYGAMGDNIQAIASVLSRDSQLTVFKTTIPEEVKVGGRQSTKLTFADSQELVFDLDMPFSVQKEETVAEPEVVEEPVVEEPESEPEPEKKMSPLVLGGIIAGAVVLLIIIIVVIVVIVKKKNQPEEEEEEEPDHTEYADSTEMVQDALNAGVNDLFGNSGKAMVFRFTMTDRKDPSKNFQCALERMINLGRAPENDIVVNYDKSISSKHCMIANKNGRFFIQDLGSANKTFVNGRQIVSSQEIRSGNVLRMGRLEFIVKFEKV